MDAITNHARATPAGNPPSLSYSGPHRLKVGVLGGARLTEDRSVTSAKVTPPLPLGLTLGSGYFSGTPRVLSPPTTYIFTVTNRNGSSTLRAQLEVVRGPASNLVVPNLGNSDRRLASTETTRRFATLTFVMFAVSALLAGCNGSDAVEGSNATTSPPSTTPGGSTSTTPTNPPVLLYNGPHSLEIHTPTGASLTDDQSVTSASVTPPLPAGLTMGNGYFNGAPRELSPPTAYTFTVTNAAGSSTLTAQFEVVGGPLFYASPASPSVGVPITPLTPRLMSSFSNFTITPDLPPGLSLNATTGVISGTPINAQPTQSYEIGATGELSNVTFGILLGVNDPTAPPAISLTTNFNCTYSGNFVGTYQGDPPDEAYGLVAIVFMPDGSGVLATDDLATNTGLNTNGGNGLASDGTFQLGESGSSSTTASGRFVGTDWLEGDLLQRDITRHLKAARIGGSAGATTRFSEGFRGLSVNYPTSFAAIDVDSTGKMTGIKYQFGTGIDTLSFAHLSSFKGMIQGTIATVFIDGGQYDGTYMASSTTLDVGDPYDEEPGPFENGTSLVDIQGCHPN